VRTIDAFYAEAMRLAKIVRKPPDMFGIDAMGAAAYRRRVKAQRWVKSAARLAVLMRAIDDYATRMDGLPARWEPKLMRAIMNACEKHKK
jgi:hypothetical protein